ncbi:MAG: hypothetical protein COA78_23920 [Blastopirellula sp.]|nr:MAG: hypothetical protein COA78_23920 [Blastopirellula sp.]
MILNNTSHATSITGVNIVTSTIEERKLSTVSMMPDGLLNTIKREEILSLLAFLQSGEKESK